MDYIVLDLEWNQGADGKREKTHDEIPFEIIEFGAIKLDSHKNTIGQFQELVKPSIYKEMPRIIESMLHIDMEDLRSGSPFPEVMNRFLEWCGKDFIFCTWGSLDLIELQRNMRYYEMPALSDGPFAFLDVQKLFGIAFENNKSCKSLEYAVDFLEIEKDIPFHRAFSDAYYTAKVLSQISTDVEQYCSYDIYHVPKTKQDEVHKIFPSYSKYISRLFADKQDLIGDREVLSTKCYICGKLARRKIKWFTPNGKHYYCVSFCDKHGFLKGKIRVRKNVIPSYQSEESVYAVKTIKLIGVAELEDIKQKRDRARKQRQVRRQKEKQQ